MKIVRKSMISGKVHERNLDITQEQIDKYNAGTLLQDAFPNLSDAEREFFKTGITELEWDNTFGDDDEN